MILETLYKKLLSLMYKNTNKLLTCPIYIIQFTHIPFSSIHNLKIKIKMVAQCQQPRNI